MLFDFTHDHDGERLSGVYGVDPSGVTAVVLHGAGPSSTERLLPLVREFVVHGCRGIAFDFSGHGESIGKLTTSSTIVSGVAASGTSASGVVVSPRRSFPKLS
ncbi:hypothetical protein ACWC9Q_37760, partial [Streptomyces sp. NPDC001142]